MCYAEPGLNLHLPSISEFSIQFFESRDFSCICWFKNFIWLSDPLLTDLFSSQFSSHWPNAHRSLLTFCVLNFVHTSQVSVLFFVCEVLSSSSTVHILLVSMKCVLIFCYVHHLPLSFLLIPVFIIALHSPRD